MSDLELQLFAASVKRRTENGNAVVLTVQDGISAVQDGISTVQDGISAVLKVDANVQRNEEVLQNLLLGVDTSLAVAPTAATAFAEGSGNIVAVQHKSPAQ